MLEWLKFNFLPDAILLKKYLYDEGQYVEALKLFDKFMALKIEDHKSWYWKAIINQSLHFRIHYE